MISLMEEETRETQNHWKCLKFTYFHDSVDGEGSVGNPESLKMIGFPCIVHDFLNGERSAGNPESLKMQRHLSIHV